MAESLVHDLELADGQLHGVTLEQMTATGDGTELHFRALSGAFQVDRRWVEGGHNSIGGSVLLRCGPDPRATAEAIGRLGDWLEERTVLELARFATYSLLWDPSVGVTHSVHLPRIAA